MSKTETLVESLESERLAKVLVIGAGATIAGWSDRHAATVTGIVQFKSGTRKGEVKAIVAKRDDWKVVAGSMHDGSAKYMFTRNNDAPEETYTLRKDGRWVSASGDRLYVGHRDKWYDPSF